MAFTPDHNPLVGPLPYRPGEYIAAGYSGHGMPITFSAGKAVAEMIAGKTPELFVEAFLPSRVLSAFD
jgi:glycine/D-amino acid oxidase-like deaminating enzyme